MKIFPQIGFFTIAIFTVFYSSAQQPRGDVRIMFYNVENLFDTRDDPQTEDEEFMPENERHWNSRKFQNKLTAIAKVVIAAGGWEPPDIIGICEVENRFVVAAQ